MKKRMMVLGLCLISLLLLAGCASTPFTGTWLEEGSGWRVEFNKKNLLTFYNEEGVGVSCTYTYDEAAGTLSLSMNAPFGDDDFSGTFAYTIVDQVLTLTDEHGVATKYTKQ